MRRIAILCFATLAFAALPLGAQAAHPDFSGKWTLDTTKLEGPMVQAGVTAATLTIAQTDKTLKEDQSVTASMGTQAVSATFNLDGTESKNSVTMGPQTMDETSTTSWDGTTLVITTNAEIQGSAFTRTDRYSLDPSGKVLTVDSSLSIMGQTLAYKQTFNKSA